MPLQRQSMEEGARKRGVEWDVGCVGENMELAHGENMELAHGENMAIVGSW